MHHNNIEGAKSKGAEKASKYLWEKTCECCREKHREKLWKKHTTMKCSRKLILIVFQSAAEESIIFHDKRLYN